MTRLHGVVAPLRPGTPQTLDVLVTLPDGRRVHGTVGDVFTGDDGRARIVRATYSRLKAKQQLTLWITLLAVAAAGDQGNNSAQRVGAGVFVGRAPRGGGTATVTLRRPDDALSLLYDLVRLRDEGLRRPLPLPLDPALAFADNDGTGRRAQWALTSARRTFEDRFGPGTSPYVRFAFGGDLLAEVGFDEILTVATGRPVPRRRGYRALRRRLAVRRAGAHHLGPGRGASGGDMRQPEPFDITADLPEHTTVLEASAGTGKTYAIVGLAARHLAEGVPISQMLLVTFSRAATAELRERMRSRVRELVGALADPADALTTAERTGDLLLRQLADGPSDTVATRRRNLSRALSDFDASTIATTHTFCNRMLEALGFLGEREFVYSIVEEVDDLTEEVALDLYLRGFWASETPEFSFSDARDIARDAVRQASVELAPTEAELAEDPVAARRVNFARAVRRHVEDRKRDARVRTYDDLQAILRRIVTDDVVGEQACRRIRDAFSVVLVDEFQDTDPLQWDILRRCFHGHRRMILVGDPKQSIYGFRGAEVLSYLAAVSSADTLKALDVNRRSDGALVDALGQIYGDATLGHPDIVARPVRAAVEGSRLEAGCPPLRIRAFLRGDFTSLNSYNLPSVGDVRSRVIADVADDIAATLARGTTIDDDGVTRPVDPGDIAVLVRLNSTIEPLQRELAARGVNSVIGSGVNVFTTTATRHWLWVLRAMEQPSRPDRVRLAAMTTLFGWSAERVATASESQVAELATELASLARVFVEGGFAAMAQRLFDGHRVAARVLGVEKGERTLTDLIQVSALCNKHVVETGEGLSAVVEWLTERVDDTSSRQRHEDQSRRLDRDTQAVQIMTVHASKGLQFPIVYVPFGWDGTWIGDRGNLTYHDEKGIRRLDVGGKGAPGVRTVGAAMPARSPVRTCACCMSR